MRLLFFGSHGRVFTFSAGMKLFPTISTAHEVSNSPNGPVLHHNCTILFHGFLSRSTS